MRVSDTCSDRRSHLLIFIASTASVCRARYAGPVLCATADIFADVEKGRYTSAFLEIQSVEI